LSRIVIYYMLLTMIYIITINKATNNFENNEMVIVIGRSSHRRV